jgi:hypothetical protein
VVEDQERLPVAERLRQHRWHPRAGL